jgi:chromosomal replication initiation ATPase DnaA
VDNIDLASPSLGSATADDLWDSGSAALRAQLAEGTWNTWFREVRPLRCEGNVLVLAVPSAVACERIRSSYAGLLTDLLHDATGRDVEVELVVDTTERRDDPVVMTAPTPLE